MKRLFLFLMLVVVGLGCLGLYAQSNQRQGERDSKSQMVREMLESKHFVVNCDRIYPQRGQSRYVGNDYSLEIKGDSVRSYLPYIGVAHSANYGSTNILDFDEEYTNYTFKEGKKESVQISFTVVNENESLEYYLTVYPNGTTRIFIQPMRRDAVTFNGELQMETKK